MNDDIKIFIDKARSKGLSDEEIRSKLSAAGWTDKEIESGLDPDDLVVPIPHRGEEPAAPSVATSPSVAGHPISVVENLTPRGFEYKILSVSLIIALLGFILVADSFMNGAPDLSWAAFPLTMFIVTGPIALYMFMRLRRAELVTPELKKDPSRRKVVQAILLVTFLGVIAHTITLFYMILSGHYAASMDYYGYTPEQPSLLPDVLRWLVTVVIAGGTFVYFWLDEKRNAR